MWLPLGRGSCRPSVVLQVGIHRTTGSAPANGLRYLSPENATKAGAACCLGPWRHGKAPAVHQHPGVWPTRKGRADMTPRLALAVNPHITPEQAAALVTLTIAVVSLGRFC